MYQNWISLNLFYYPLECYKKFSLLLKISLSYLKHSSKFAQHFQNVVDVKTSLKINKQIDFDMYGEKLTAKCTEKNFV